MIMIVALENVTSSCYKEQHFCNSTIWLVLNISLSIATILGNILTILAIILSRKLSSVVANQFVFSLGVSDLFVGLTIPYHMSFYLVTNFGSGRVNCLLRFVLIAFACSSSVLNLLCIAIDRYLAIVYPLHYTRYMTRKTALVMTAISWVGSFLLAAIPLMWNDWHTGVKCEMVDVLPGNYLNFIVSPMFALIWVMMLLLYTRICREANGQVRRMRNNTNNIYNNLAFRDSKSFQVMMTILGCFTICWLPYIIVAQYLRVSKHPENHTIYEVAFNLAVTNSGMNPVIYAWKNSNFRKAFFAIAKCKSPNQIHSDMDYYVTNHVRVNNATRKKTTFFLRGICNSVFSKLEDKVEDQEKDTQITTISSTIDDSDGIRNTSSNGVAVISEQ